MSALDHTDKAFLAWEKTCDPIFVKDEDGDWVELDGPEYILIEKIYVPKHLRGHGIARKMMEDALKEIDDSFPGLDIMLVCDPQDDETEMDRLSAFYESFGFYFCEGAPGQMKKTY